MKVFAGAFLLALSSGGLAQPVHDHGVAPARSHRALGVVESVNAQTHAVTIRHEPVVSLEWPAMTMRFKAKDHSTLARLEPGREVNFEFERRGKDYVITAVNPGWGSCSADCPMNKEH